MQRIVPGQGAQGARGGKATVNEKDLRSAAMRRRLGFRRGLYLLYASAVLAALALVWLRR